MKKAISWFIRIVFILQALELWSINYQHDGGGAWYYVTRSVISRYVLLAISYIIIRLGVKIFFALVKKIKLALRILPFIIIIPISAFLFYCSGQTIGIQNGYDCRASTGSLLVDFDWFHLVRFDVGNVPSNKYGGDYIYRNTSIDTVPYFAAYSNKGIFRDYYLTKDRKLRVIRGLGILLNLPDVPAKYFVVEQLPDFYLNK